MTGEGAQYVTAGSALVVERCFACVVMTTSLAGLREHGALRGDHRQKILPGFDERLGSLVLEPSREGVDVDAGLREPRQHLFAVAAVGGQEGADVAVVGERLQGRLWHGVDRERRGK